MSNQRSDAESLLAAVSFGFVGDYITWASEQTDAPRVFHLAGGLVDLAAAAGNRYHVTCWGQRRHPNLYVLRIAESGFMRKGASQGLNAQLLARAVPEAILANDFSPEKFIELLAEQSWGLIRAGEFGEVLARFQRDYMAGMRQLITDWWDGVPAYTRDTKSGGRVTVNEPAVTFDGASTIEWLKPYLRKEDAAGGFLGRFLPFRGRHKHGRRGLVLGSDAWTEKPAGNHLVQHLHTIREGSGEMDARAVQAVIDEWVFATEDDAEAGKYPEEVHSFVGRLATHALKLTICFELGRDPESRVLSRVAAEAAIVTLQYLLHDLAELVQELTWTSDADKLERLKRLIRHNGGQERSALLRETRWKAKELNEYLRTLLESGEVREEKRSTSGRHSSVYRAVTPSTNGALHR